MSDLDLTRADNAQEFQFVMETACLLEAAKGKASEAEIIKNTQAYLSGKGEPKEKEEYKPFISQSDAVKDEMRRRQIFAITPSYSTHDSFHPEPALVDAIAPPEMIEPGYTFRDGLNDTLGIVGSLTDAAAPFLMWDLAKDHARNQNNFYRRTSHYEDYGHAPYRNFQDPYYRGYRNHGSYGNYGNYGNYGRRFGGNLFPQDSDMEFSHAGPDGLTFSRSRQRMPRGNYNDYQGGDYNQYPRGGYNNYRGNGINDTLDLLNGLSSAAMPWLQWDLAKQHARNQRDFYRNRR